VAKPFPSYQLFKGTVFQLVDQAVDFVLARPTARSPPIPCSPNPSTSPSTSSASAPAPAT
jgi:hypothetical protein